MPGKSATRLSWLACMAAVVGTTVAAGAAHAQNASLPYGNAAARGTEPLSAFGDGSQAIPTADGLRGATSDDPAFAPDNRATQSPLNYGRPRPKKPVLYTPNPRASRPLPQLVPYATASGTRKRVPAAPTGDTRRLVTPATTPAPTIAAVPLIERRPRPRVDAAPFAPTGVDVGSLRLTPFVETGLGYDTNPNRQSFGVKASPFARADVGIGAQSQWSEHNLTADLHGGYSDYFRNHNADHPDGAGKINSRIDVLRETQIDLEGRFLLSTQTPGSPQIAVPGSTYITNRPPC